MTINVTDNGPGIDESIGEKIFEPFYTTKKNGTGLGLSIVKSIVESHKGIVKAENHPEGASFVIQIPLTDKTQHNEEEDAIE